MAPARCLALALVGFVLGAASVSVSCGGGGTSSTGAGGPALIEVETSSLFMSVVNRSGGALNDVHISIVPVGGATQFVATISRMESGEKRDLSLAEFRGRDGTPFSLRVHKPKTVRVSGTNLDGKAVEVEKPWR